MEGRQQVTAVDQGAALDRCLEFRTPAKPENLGVLRAVVSAVAMFEDLDVDAVSDLRLAVDEASTLVLQAAIPESALVVQIEPRVESLVVRVSAASEATTEWIVGPGSFSWHVLQSLTDDVETFTESRAESAPVRGISLTARRLRPHP
jgi:hypothetical protein